MAPRSNYTSWSGQALEPQDPTAEQARRLRDADAALAARPDDVELTIRAARAREDVWRYGEAVDLYGRAMASSPDDYRLPLCRAHRLIRLREPTAALADLDRAKTLDPTGFNTAYLRGFTLYLMGRFADASEEYGRCLSLPDTALAGGFQRGDPRQCVDVATDPASRVALTSWTVRACGRAGRRSELQRILNALPRSLDPGALEGPSARHAASPIVPDDNAHYWTLLRCYRGELEPERLLEDARGTGQWPTLAYGVAAWRIIAGDVEAARPLLEEIVADPHWARLGHVAAEADLLRLPGAVQARV